MVKNGKEPAEFKGLFVKEITELLKSIKRSKLNLAVKIVFGDGRAGMVYFSKSKLVHAEFGDRLGELAFLEMLGRSGGSYEIVSDLAADVVSIERDVKDLITESGLGKDTTQPKQETGELEIEKVAGGETIPEWSPPPPPPKGFQEEAWMKDWGRGTPGFLAAVVMRRDGTQIMGVVADEEIKESLGNLTRIKQLLDSASVFTGAPDDKGVRTIRIETSRNLCFVSALAENFFLAVFTDVTKTDGELLKQRFQQLVDVLNTSLEKG